MYRYVSLVYERGMMCSTGLEANMKYDVRVLAGTAVGFPNLRDEHWPWISQVTDQSGTGGETVVNSL